MATRDKIFLRDHVREIEIGAFEEERGVLQRVRFAIEVLLSDPAAGDDDVDRIMSYDLLMEAIDQSLAGQRISLLETLAERIAQVLLSDARAQSVGVRIEKLDRGDKVLGLEILRSREASPVSSRAKIRAEVCPLPVDCPSPRQATGLGRVYVPGIPLLNGEERLSHETHLMCRLLEADRLAWTSADELGGLAVVASETELRYALREGRSVVWAPLRLLRDAQPMPSDLSAASLARWLKVHLQLSE